MCVCGGGGGEGGSHGLSANGVLTLPLIFFLFQRSLPFFELFFFPPHVPGSARSLRSDTCAVSGAVDVRNLHPSVTDDHSGSPQVIHHHGNRTTGTDSRRQV